MMDPKQFARFAAASDHPYSCQCGICKEWWELMGPEPEDEDEPEDGPAVLNDPLPMPTKFQEEYLAAVEMLKHDNRVLTCALVGSAGYMPEPTDVDILVLTRDNLPPPPIPPKVDTNLLDFWSQEIEVEKWNPTDALNTIRWYWPEYALCAGEYDIGDEGRWAAIRKGNVNLIITADRDWFDKFLLADTVCEALRLESKTDRMVVFRVLRDDMSPDEARAAVFQGFDPNPTKE